MTRRIDAAGSEDAPRSLKIMVCEDDPEMRALLRRQLERLGHAAHFSDGPAGLLSKLVEEEIVYDLAIVDLKLPGIHGSDIISWLADSELPILRRMPILILTGYPEQLPIGFLDEHRNCRLLPKPHTLADLRDVLAQCTDRRH